MKGSKMRYFVVCLLIMFFPAVSNAESGNTPLHDAARSGNIEVIAALAKAEADLNAKNKNGDTPLHVAARHGVIEAIKALLEQGADPKTKNNEGETPLDIAMSNNRAEAVTILKAHKH